MLWILHPWKAWQNFSKKWAPVLQNIMSTSSGILTITLYLMKHCVPCVWNSTNQTLYQSGIKVSQTGLINMVTALPIQVFDMHPLSFCVLVHRHNYEIFFLLLDSTTTNAWNPANSSAVIDKLRASCAICIPCSLSPCPAWPYDSCSSRVGDHMAYIAFLLLSWAFTFIMSSACSWNTGLACSHLKELTPAQHAKGQLTSFVPV